MGIDLLQGFVGATILAIFRIYPPSSAVSDITEKSEMTMQVLSETLAKVVTALTVW